MEGWWERALGMGGIFDWTDLAGFLLGAGRGGRALPGGVVQREEPNQVEYILYFHSCWHAFAENNLELHWPLWKV